MKTKIETGKYLALLEEFETANKLVKLGFGELQRINLSNDFYFLPFQLLSQGFERFMKSYICVAYFERNQEMPDFKYLKNLGHDITKLLNEILNEYFIVNKPDQFRLDYDLLTKNSELKELLIILSEFGKISRYYNFDLITGNKKIGINAKEAWQKFENKVFPLTEEKIEKLMNFDLNNEVYEEITSYIIVIFEKFIAALSRQIIFNSLGQNGKQLTIGSFFDFGLIYDGEFGKTDYRKETSKFKSQDLKIHKRTVVDEIDRLTNPKIKSKRIRKEEFGEQWPFYVDEVTIECRNKIWCLVTIEGHDYSLNGSAKGKYKLENPHDGGMAILGKSIGPFIKMALEL